MLALPKPTSLRPMRLLPCGPNWPHNLPGSLQAPLLQVPLFLLLLLLMVLKSPFLRPPWVLLPHLGLLLSLVLPRTNSVAVLPLLVVSSLCLVNKALSMCTYLALVG